MPALPAETAPDSTLQFRADPYRFISSRCDAHGTDAFEARILLEKAICLRGAPAAELFYDADRFRRAGALPGRIAKLLFGLGGVQGMDGAAHRHRKAMHLALMTRERMEAFDAVFARRLRAKIPEWTAAGEITMHDPLVQVAAEAAVEWCGLGTGHDLDRRRKQMQGMFERAGTVGPAYWSGRLGRRQAEAWAADLVRATRDGLAFPPEGTALQVIAGWRDEDGDLLPEDVAAVELLNALRPITAVGDWLVFALHALAVHGVRPGSAAQYRQFQLELRRHYPYFPALGARTTRRFTWNGIDFPEDRLVLLDIHGTNHDPRAWADPGVFRPARFDGRDPTPWDMIPQGGGDPARHHRCSGEWLTERMIETTARFFTEELAWEVPEQDLSLDMRRLPALPRDGMRLSGLRRR